MQDLSKSLVIKDVSVEEIKKFLASIILIGHVIIGVTL
jgi:hypothetical protein